MRELKNGKIRESQDGKRINIPSQSFFREHIGQILIVLLFGLLASFISGETLKPAHIVGRFFITGLLLLIFYRDILRYKPDYIKKKRMLLLLGFLVLFTILFGRAFQYFFENFAVGIGLFPPDTSIYGMPIPTGAILVTLIFDFHTAIIFSFIVSLLTGLWAGEPAYPIYAFIGSIVGAFSVMRCKKRTDILKGGICVSGVNIFTLLGILLFTDRIFGSYSSTAILYAAASGILVSSVVSLLLPVIELSFKVTTDITLLELLDLNQPVMKNLMITAPGTYHHSIITGNLVESVAEEIGVNPLLARVTAYYHDIGKIRMPEYFVENQQGTLSKHDRLSPHMSSIILTSHVKDGVEIAREYNLPEPVIDVIQQHHGTCLMTYFYQKARDAGNGEPAEDDYRYHGPKPQSRVTALVMLADAVEAASRVLKEPTPARIESLVDRIVNHIFIDGQLEECELTLKDISKIKKKFTYILTGIMHRRIEYPGFEFDDKIPTSIGEQQAAGLLTGKKEETAKKRLHEGRGKKPAEKAKDKPEEGTGHLKAAW